MIAQLKNIMDAMGLIGMLFINKMKNNQVKGGTIR